MNKKTFKKTLVKDLYEKIQSKEISRRDFQDWLMWYRHKHWGIGVDDVKAGKV